MTPTKWCNEICCRFFQVRKSVALGEYIAFLQYTPVVEKLQTFLKKTVVNVIRHIVFCKREKKFPSSKLSLRLCFLGQKYAAHVNFGKIEYGDLGHLFYLIREHPAVVGTYELHWQCCHRLMP